MAKDCQSLPLRFKNILIKSLLILHQLHALPSIALGMAFAIPNINCKLCTSKLCTLRVDCWMHHPALI
jgi:hypothetical protein